MKKIADQIAEFLKTIGVRHVFGIPSGPWTTFMNAFDRAGLEFVLVSNEASAGFMAEVNGRLTGIPGVCYGTLGPGATNLSTGVGGALLDRSPLIAFTTEPPDSMLGRTTQMAIDHQALFRPITKWTTRLSEEGIEETLSKAVEIATSGLPGSVHIGLPADIGDKPAGETKHTPPRPGKIQAPDAKLVARLTELFAAARRPLLAAGLTAVRSKAGDMIRRIAETHRVPVVLTPMAKGLVSEDHPAYAGVLFHALSDIVAETNRQADLVVGVGYDPIEFNYEDWLPDAPLVHLDIVGADKLVSVAVCGGIGQYETPRGPRHGDVKEKPLPRGKEQPLIQRDPSPAVHKTALAVFQERLTDDFPWKRPLAQPAHEHHGRFRKRPPHNGRDPNAVAAPRERARWHPGQTSL